MIDSKDYDFSFSGLKTAVLYLIKNLEAGAEKFGPRRISLDDRPKEGQLLGEGKPITKATIANICKELQQAIIDVLVAKTLRAAKEFKVKTIILGGGVVANKELRKQMASAIKKDIPNSKFLIPDSAFTIDNAAMIATAGYLHALNKEFAELNKITAQGNLTF